jgi:hypothetical protein
MADLGNTDFRMTQQIDPVAIARLQQQRAVDEQNMALQQQEIQTSKQNRTMQIIEMAGKLTQSMIAAQSQQEMDQGRKHVAEILQSGNNPVSNANQMVPAASSAVPQLSQAPTAMPFSQTPDYKAQLQSALLQANPGFATKDMAAAQFLPETSKNEQIVQTLNPDGSVGYTKINKATNKTTSITGLQSPGVTPEQRNQMIGARQTMANASQARTELSSIQSGPGAVEQGKIQQARHLDQLLYQTYDKKSGQYNVKPFQYTELSLGLARLVSPQSVVAQQLENKIEQPTTKGDLAKLYVRITGDTSTDISNASTQDIIKLYADTIERQGNTAEDNRNEAYTQAQAALGKKSDTSSLMSYKQYHNKVKTLAGIKGESSGGLNVDQNALDAELKRRGL